MIARRRSDRIFARALVLSLLLHLSAVTLFRIIFYFPHKDIEFFSVSIKQTPGLPATSPVPADRLSLAQPDFDATGETQASLPFIELPALKFESMDQLRIRQEALQTRSRFDEFFANSSDRPPGPSEGGLGTLRETLSRLTFGAPEEGPAAPTPVSRPAPGFEAYIEWLSPPMDRKVLAVAPIDALWGLSQDALPEPITLAFRVDRAGIVEPGVITLSGSSELVYSVGIALRRYRFEPLLGEGPPTQSGTFIVRAGGESP